jgi:hypothetical protein
MKTYLVSPDGKRSKLTHTTNHPASHYGIGVLLIPKSCKAYQLTGDLLDGFRFNSVLVPDGWKIETDNIKAVHQSLGIPDGNQQIIAEKTIGRI